MNSFVKLIVRVAVPLALASTLIGGGTVSAVARAQEKPDLPPLALANPQAPLALIESFPEWLQQRSDYYVDPDLPVGVSLVYPDGSIVPGQSGAQLLGAYRCSIDVWASMLHQTWTFGCAITGYPGYTVVYQGTNQGPSNMLFCMKVKGFELVAHTTIKIPFKPVTTYSYEARWYNGGCSQDRSTTVRVPWGNVIAHPAAEYYTSFGYTQGTIGVM